MRRSVGRRTKARAEALIEGHSCQVTLLVELDRDGSAGVPQAVFRNGRVSGWVGILARLEANIEEMRGST